MDIQKLQISQQKIDINLQFYFFLKYSVKLKPNDKQLNQMFEILHSAYLSSVDGQKLSLENIFTSQNSEKFNVKVEIIKEILLKCYSKEDLELLSIALRLYQVKNALLHEAKMTESVILKEKLKTLHPLSLEYDALSILKPYSTRVHGSLLSLLFFEKLSKNETSFMCEGSYDFLEKLAKDIKKFQKSDLESNQIFMLMFSEVINQSIISDSGSNYEQRIFSILSDIGIENITKQHDKNDKSTEFDFFFELNSKTYGIGAKRTLRERYKQFIKTAFSSNIDIMIEITLGFDLNYQKAETIISHGTYLFVADEIYQRQKFLRDMDKVFSVKDLSLEGLKKLI